MNEKKPASWWERLTSGLGRSSGSLARGLRGLLVNRKLDAETLDELEDLLIQSDMGVDVATHFIDGMRKTGFDKTQGMEPVIAALVGEVYDKLHPVEKPFIKTTPQGALEVVLVIGVNGSGKTTSIGKLASNLAQDGQKVVLAAADTFRAAAIEQLKAWASRAKVTIIAGEQGADASSLVYKALKEAEAQKADYLLIDTAGRLHNKTHLMEELGKIKRVIAKQISDAPHQVLLVLDATTGQNALGQAEAFSKAASVSGLIMTKLDGSAKGGVLVALANKTALPIHFIGVGEQQDDLLPFEARAFADALVGRETPDGDVFV